MATTVKIWREEPRRVSFTHAHSISSSPIAKTKPSLKVPVLEATHRYCIEIVDSSCGLRAGMNFNGGEQG